MQIPAEWSAEIPKAIVTAALAIISYSFHRGVKKLNKQSDMHKDTRIKSNISFNWIAKTDPSVKDTYEIAKMNGD